MHERRRNPWVSWLPALALAGCGGGGSGGIETPPPVDDPTPPGMAVSGQVTKAPLDSADIGLFPIDTSGAVSGAAVATTTTQSDGSFTAVIPQGAGPLLIGTSGGSYVDEADREPDPALKRRVVLGAGEGLESLLPDGVSSVAVSIVTQALLDKARRETVAGAFLEQFAANRALATQAFGFDIVTTLPADPINPDPGAAEVERQYAMLLGGLANLANRFALDAGLAEPDINSILAVVEDFSDGRIDGMVAGAPVMVGTVQAGAFSINEEIARFRNNNFDAYESTPLLVVDEDVFSQIPPPVNVAPLATDDSFQIGRGAALTITAPGVLVNDTDANGDSLTATLVTPPGSSIAFSLQADGSFSYQHDGVSPGMVTFEYVASDGLADSNVATVTIDVANITPVAADDALTLAEGASGSGDVLGNDSDGDNDPLTATLIDAPVNGQVVLAADGSFTYTHDDSETTSDSFTYVANDGFDDSALATVSITVTPVNDQVPVAVDDAVTVAEGGQVSDRVLDNDTDGDTLLLTARLIDGPLNGQLTFDVNGVFTYTHDGGETASDSFTYVANDGDFDSNTGTVSVTVTPVNDPPVANDDAATAPRGGTTTMLDSGDSSVLSNDTDAEGDSLNAQLADPPASGQLTLNADGTFSYTHDGSAADTDSFAYFANDGADDSNIAIVQITIGNAVPVAVADCISVAEGASVSVVNGVCPSPRPRAGQSAGARTPLPRPTRGPDFLTGVSGTLQLLSQPPPSVEPFAFQNDVTLPVFLEQPQFGLSRPAVVNLTEPGVYGPGGNDGNNAGACLPINSFIGSALIHGDSTQGFPTWNGGFTLSQPLIGLITDPLDLGVSDVLMGLPSVVYPRDVDPTRGLDLVAPVAGDSLTIEPDRLAVSGIDFLLDVSSDPQLDVARIVVAPAVFPQVSLIGSLSAVMNSEPRQIDKDPMPPVMVAPEGRPLRIVDRRRAVVSLVPPGADNFIIDFQMLGSADPLIPGQPVQLVQDGPLMSVSVTEPGDYEFVLSIPDLSLVVNGPLAAGLLSNDTDLDQDPLTVTGITAQPSSGTVSIEPGGTFVYTHDGSESVSDSFGYRISDGTDTADGVVTVTVLPVDDPPVAADDVMVPIDEGGNVSILVGGATSVLDNDFDAEADSNTAQLLDPPFSAGMFALNNDGTFFYEHDGSPTTSDEFSYVVESAFTGSCVARVTVAINPVNDPPITSGIADVVDSVSAGGTIIDLFAAFDDEEDPDDALLFEVVGNTIPAIFQGVTIDAGQLELLYVSGGSSTLTIRATDSGGLSVETSFSVTLQSIIDIEKATEGVDADDPDAGDAPQIDPGGLVTWTYRVTNNGGTTLTNVSVTDDQGVQVSCPTDALAPGQSTICTASGLAEDLASTGFTTVPGLCGGVPQTPLYENIGTASALDGAGLLVQDADPSHYCNP